MDEDEDDFFNDAVFDQIDKFICAHEERKQATASSQNPEETSSPMFPPNHGGNPTLPNRQHSAQPSLLQGRAAPSNRWKELPKPPPAQHAPPPSFGAPLLGRITQAAAQAVSAPIAATHANGASGGLTRLSRDAQEGASVEELQKKLAQESGTNSLLRQKLEAAEQAKFSLQRALSDAEMEHAGRRGSSRPGDSVTIDELTNQLTSAQQQLKHYQTEAELKQHETREREERMHAAAAKASALEEELRKVRQVKDSLELELQEANRERRTRAAEGLAPQQPGGALVVKSPNQLVSATPQKRKSLTLSGSKRTRGSTGTTDPSSSTHPEQAAPSPGAALATPQAHSSSPVQAQASPTGELLSSPSSAAGCWRLRAPGGGRTGGAQMLRILMADCSSELSLLLSVEASGASDAVTASSQPTTSQLAGSPEATGPAAAHSQLQSRLAGKVRLSMQMMNSGDAHTVSLCTDLINFLGEVSDLPGEPEPPLLRPRSGGGRSLSVWRLGAPGPSDWSVPIAAMSVLNTLLSYDGQSVQTALRSCGMSAALRHRLCVGHWELPARASLLPEDSQDAKGVLGLPEPFSSNMPTSHSIDCRRRLGTSLAVVDEVANGSHDLLAAVLNIVLRFSGQAASKEGLLLAAVGTLQSLMTCASRECPSLMGKFSALLDDNGPLRQLLRAGSPTGASPASAANNNSSNSSGGSSGPREQVPCRLRAAVLSLMSSCAPGSSDLLSAWGIGTATEDTNGGPSAGRQHGGNPCAGLPDLLLENLELLPSEELLLMGDSDGGALRDASVRKGGVADERELELVRHLKGVLLSSRLSTSCTPPGSSSSQGASIRNLLSTTSVWEPSALIWAFEVPRAVLRFTAALLANQKWQALQALLSQGLSHHLVSVVDSLSRDPLNGALEGVQPPAMLCARQAMVQQVRRCHSSRGSGCDSVPTAGLCSGWLRSQQLRLLHEGLVLLCALLTHRRLGWSVLDDLTSSNLTFRCCLTSMSRLVAAQTTNSKAASHHQQEDAASVGLAQWAVELQRKRASLPTPLQPGAPLAPGESCPSLGSAASLADYIKRRVIESQMADMAPS